MSQLCLSLAPSMVVEVGTPSEAAARRAEEQNNEKFSELEWQCIPIVIETYGSCGAKARQTLSQLAL